VPPGAASRPTLHDVAREARVGVMTVSRVVNGEPSVRPETAARVRTAIAKLGYQPNDAARSLKGQRSRTLGLVIADITNSFYAGCAKAIEEVARSHGYAVILCDSGEQVDIERQQVDVLARRRVDGLLLVPAANGHAYLADERLAEVPVVALDRPIPGIPTDAVVVQNRRGAREATEHLIGHGHRHIVYIGAGERLYTTRERRAGYREALKAAGLMEMSWVDVADSAAAERAMRDALALPTPPTAVFAMNNLITIGVLQALDHLGLRAPHDVALIGFDDFDLAALLHPRLTLVRQPAAEMGRRAAELLFDRLEGRSPKPVQRVVLATELIVRESCGCRHDRPAVQCTNG